MKDLAYYMAQPYTFTLIPDSDEPGYAIKVNELPGCISQGTTSGEALTRIREAMEVWIESAIEDGQEVPEPGDTHAYSGKFLVRLPKSIHRAIALAAEREGVSLNLFAASALARAAGAFKA
jgi:antitoxin HicB